MTRVALCSEAKNEPFIFSIQAKFLDKKTALHVYEWKKLAV